MNTLKGFKGLGFFLDFYYVKLFAVDMTTFMVAWVSLPLVGCVDRGPPIFSILVSKQACIDLFMFCNSKPTLLCTILYGLAMSVAVFWIMPQMLGDAPRALTSPILAYAIVGSCLQYYFLSRQPPPVRVRLRAREEFRRRMIGIE